MDWKERRWVIKKEALAVLRKLRSTVMDLVPIIAVVAFFQVVVLRQPFPQLGEIVFGSILVVIGLMLFIEGLEMGLFPIGEAMAHALARKGSLFWLILFSFSLGFSTVIASPGLIAVSQEAARIASEASMIDGNENAITAYSLGLRLSVGISVGIALVLGMIRILKGWPLYYFVIAGYLVVMIMTIFAPEQIISLAFDAGGVATSEITVPLITALGVGLAAVLKGRSPLIDGFGIIILAVIMPIIFVMGYGLIMFR
ncbi:MAG: DUF1538 domain-containing protein [Saprospiraceae bacterium]